MVMDIKRILHTNLNNQFETIATTVMQQVTLMEDLIHKGWQDAVYDQMLKNEDTADDMETEVMQKLPVIVALLAPKGGGLRLIISSHEIVVFFENIGDLLMDMAEKWRTTDLSIPEYAEFQLDFQKMFLALKTILHAVTFSFVKEDKSPAYALLGKEDDITRLSHELSANLAAVFQDMPLTGQELMNVMNLNAIAYIMEKIKNIAINIAKSIIFAKEGTDMRHLHYEK